MTDVLAIDAATGAAAFWPLAAALIESWARRRGVPLAETVVLVPWTPHIGCAQRAFAARPGGVLPTIETVRTLVRASGPPAPVPIGQLCFDTALDRLTANALLQSQSGGGGALRQSAAALVDTAHGIARAASALAPPQRAAYWARCRAILFRMDEAADSGRAERLLTRVALEWAASAPAPATDVLFCLRPAAWIVIDPWPAPGDDAPSLERSLLDVAAAIVPCLRVDAAAADATPRLALSVCRDFEDEAQRTAATVVDHLNAGRQPVALIAQDRLIVRRVHALLARQQVPVHDETGWRLSTTRAAASLHSLLRCARHDAEGNDALAWLKSCPDAPAAALDALEARWRDHRVRLLMQTDAHRLPPAAASLWSAAAAVLQTLTAPPRRTWAAWRRALHAALQAFGLAQALRADAAGVQLLAALGLPVADDGVFGDDAPFPGGTVDVAAFARWVDDTLEQRTYLPPFERSAAQPEPLVVITPLSRCALRPFGAVVLPGADARRLGAGAVAPTLLGDKSAPLFGLPDRAAARAREAADFAQLSRQPHVDVSYRLDEDGEALVASPLLQRLRFAPGAPITLRADDRPHADIAARPVEQPLPAAPMLLPARLSASACETLRACPYRFFALRLLRLRVADELDAELDKRDYGNWLHAVLHRFHSERPQPRPEAEDAAALAVAAADLQLALRLDAADFLAFDAAFKRFAPRYLSWLAQRDAEGAHWLDGERSFDAQPAGWGGIAMHGVIDRIDSVAPDGGGQTQVIDYKTGASDTLKRAVATGEDTQLAFYAALLQLQPAAADDDLSAMYLMLDETQRIVSILHPDVAESGRRLVAGIGADLQRLRAGAPMRALGEGAVCTHCEARGLCRRDHWAPPATSAATTSEVAR